MLNSGNRINVTHEAVWVDGTRRYQQGGRIADLNCQFSEIANIVNSSGSTHFVYRRTSAVSVFFLFIYGKSSSANAGVECTKIESTYSVLLLLLHLY